jgi:hypothetical protein
MRWEGDSSREVVEVGWEKHSSREPAEVWVLELAEARVRVQVRVPAGVKVQSEDPEEAKVLEPELAEATPQDQHPEVESRAAAVDRGFSCPT